MDVASNYAYLESGSGNSFIQSGSIGDAPASHTVSVYTCGNCGALVYNNFTHTCYWNRWQYPYQYPYQYVAPDCDHCYCQPAVDILNVKDHMKCCKCPDKRLRRFVDKTGR